MQHAVKDEWRGSQMREKARIQPLVAIALGVLLSLAVLLAVAVERLQRCFRVWRRRAAALAARALCAGQGGISSDGH